ncbi:MAG TPA: FAD-dependent oxidoreductase [Gemmatimonadaceae bacterium]|nr:FAD-dependent oxidoreductase [Gemmatimonadaceae bacterium]
MAKPVILAVDDEPDVLAAVERDLRQRYRADYRLVAATSGSEALDATNRLAQRGVPLALFLVDERMPGMTGSDFLLQAVQLFPEARRVLLTAYADTDVAIAAINNVKLDHYLLKPWEPPTERLYPVLDDLLADWQARHRPRFEGIRVAGTALSPASYEVRDFLSRNQIPYQWLDVETDSVARALVAPLSNELARLPVVLFPDGPALVQPALRALAERLGMQTRPQRPFYDLLVVGAGPAGLAAAVYAASEGLRTVLVERDVPGGQAGTSSQIENYLGFPGGITGADLARRAVAQARRFGAELLTTQEVVRVRREDPYRIATLSDGSELASYTVLVTTGMEVRRLEAPGVDALVGAGIYYGAALSEAAIYRGQHVAIVGGANSAGQGALFFARYARRVTMLVRGHSLEASMARYLVDRLRETPNVEIRTGTVVSGVRGSSRLEAIQIESVGGAARSELEADAMFIFIGQAPRTSMVAGLVELDAKGFVVTGPDLVAGGRRPPGWNLERDPYFYETSVPGIFAAGDARHGSGKRVAAAAGEGAATVGMVHQYLQAV